MCKRSDLDTEDVGGWWDHLFAPWDFRPRGDAVATEQPTRDVAETEAVATAPGGWRKAMLLIVIVSTPILLIVVAAMVLNTLVLTNAVVIVEEGTTSSGENKVKNSQLAAENVAKDFLNEPDPQQRLQWVRNREVVAEHLALYAEEALSFPALQLNSRGHQLIDGVETTGFAVRFASGSFRQLDIVKTPDGPQVDWDSYARYCSASWEDLLSGKEPSAEVRVFVSPGDYYNGPFADEAKWTCFRLMSPDLPGGTDVFAYAAVGPSREKQLRRIVLRAPQFRQHMTLQIQGHEAPGGNRLFEITRVLAIGWVRGERDIENDW
ncbi:MAG: hypothetical protein R3F19_30930 [Verrucomicrobiales bacterium]